MKNTRESISLALIQLLQNEQASQLPTICTTITRFPKLWSQVETAQMPWLQVFKAGPGTEEITQTGVSGLSKYLIHYNIWLYLRSDPTGVILAETVVNNIADALDLALQWDMKRLNQRAGERQTLGGLVNNCWLEGGQEWGSQLEGDDTLLVAWRLSVNTGGPTSQP